MEINEKQIYARLDALAKKLEVTAAQLFDVFIKRAKAEAVVDAIYAAGGMGMALIGGVGFSIFARRAYASLAPAVIPPPTTAMVCHGNAYFGDCYNAANPDISHAPQSIFLVVISVVCLAVLARGLYQMWDNGTDAVRYAMSPEVTAVEEIVDLVRG